MKSKTFLKAFVCSILLSSVLTATAEAQACKKPHSKIEVDACMQSPNVSFLIDPPKNMTADKMIAGPKYSPKFSDAEIKDSTVFCRFFKHEFSSPGSAKFLCARTTPEGILVNDKGEPVHEAKTVSTRAMKLQGSLNGDAAEIDEAILLDENNQPLIRKEHLVKGDDLKIKYFIDANQYKDSDVKRKDEVITFNNQQIALKNVFVGPSEISNDRWNEVFTEVASTRLMWALGIPADIMIPVNRIVCFGCESHPWKQNDYIDGKTAIFNNPVIERKFKGKKLNEGFAFNRVIKYQYPIYSDDKKADIESIALVARLLGYFSAQGGQDRIVCEKKNYNAETEECSAPIPFIQDLGSTWGGKVSNVGKLFQALGSKGKFTEGFSNPRGNLSVYKKENVFSDPKTCTLEIEFGIDGDKDGSTLKRVSHLGVEKLKARLETLTPEVIQALFTVSRFGDMEPSFRDGIRGNRDLQHKEVIDRWSAELTKRINEIKNATCL